MADKGSSDTPTDERILDATVAVLARDGLAGVSMRAVAQEAGVALGLANYHFDNKTELISAALRRTGERDMELVTPAPGGDPVEQLRDCLHRALDSTFLTPTYLSLRLQLWSLAGVDPQFAEINQTAQQAYLDGLSQLIAAARPNVPFTEIQRRATDVLVEQNGVWLTAILVPDRAAAERALTRCEEIALG